MFLVLNFLMLAFFDFDFTASGMLYYLSHFLHAINWPNLHYGVKLPTILFNAYKVKSIQGNELLITT